MIRDNTKKETKVFNEDRGFGIFKGWFQDSVDIASVEWENGNRTVLHKRDLTEVEDENEEVKEEVNKILKNAIDDILVYGCSSLPCDECPLFNSVKDSANDKLCDAISDI